MSSIDYFGASDDQIIWIRKFGIDVGQGINVGPGKVGKKNKRRALNSHVLSNKAVGLGRKLQN